MKTRRVFKHADLKSGEGMLTTVWGPSLWHVLHTMSFNYPIQPTSEQQEHYKSFILNLENVLPCKYCRINLKKNFKTLPLKSCHLKNRDSFSRYIYDLHEVINKMLKKKSKLSYCDVRERYEHFRARCTKKNIKKLKEKGCTEPLFDGLKAKGIIKIVPQDDPCETFQVSDQCLKKAL